VSVSPETALVTGAGGFAGSHLVELLATSGEVVGWTRSDPPPEIAPLARWTKVDLLDREAVRQEMRALRPRHVYHLAGSPSVARSWENTADTLASNVLTTHHLLDAVRRTESACRVLIAGSAHIYAASNAPLREDAPLSPGSPYAFSKLAQEEIGRRTFREDGIDVILTRPFNHTGARQTPAFAAPSMARQIALGEFEGHEIRIRVGNLDAQRDLTDVRDVVRAYRLLMERGEPGIPYNIASGVTRPVRAVLEGLIAKSAVPVTVELDPDRLRPHDTPILAGDSSRLHDATGWTPSISFQQMLADLLDHWRLQVRQ
jgi:GDP-4-dehydro-6-deoxy-D-mannose reductase